MSISVIATRRMVEDRAAADRAYRRKCERNGRPLSADVRRLSDEELLVKLHALRLRIDAARLEELSRLYPAAYQLAAALCAEVDFDDSNFAEDWAWFAIEALWQRWLPARSNFEMVDQHMQDGYSALKQRDSVEACRHWRAAWRAVLDLMQRFQIGTIEAFDERFGGTQCVFNWIQDYEMELHNAGLDEPQFFHDRIALCRTVIERFDEDELLTKNFRAALAASHFELGQREEGDRLYRQWLDDDPQWGRGWIGWSDCHYLFARPQNKDPERGLQILRQGLNVPGVRDRKVILSRLADVLTELGRPKAADIQRQLEVGSGQGGEGLHIQKHSVRLEQEGSTRRVIETFDFGEDGLPLDQWGKFTALRAEGGRVLPVAGDEASTGERWRLGENAGETRQHIGRNSPCPCGSGKKFKKCCGKRS